MSSNGENIKKTSSDNKKKSIDHEKEFLKEIRDKYMPAFTLEETRTFIKLNPPSVYICCKGCRGYCRHLPQDKKCDCCNDMCKCCAGVCMH